MIFLVRLQFQGRNCRCSGRVWWVAYQRGQLRDLCCPSDRERRNPGCHPGAVVSVSANKNWPKYENWTRYGAGMWRLRVTAQATVGLSAYPSVRYVFCHKVLTCRVQSCVWRLPKYSIDPPPPSLQSECVLPSHQRRGGGAHTRRAVRGWEVNILVFCKTPDIGFASYSIISLRFPPSNQRSRICTLPVSYRKR